MSEDESGTYVKETFVRNCSYGTIINACAYTLTFNGVKVRDNKALWSYQCDVVVPMRGIKLQGTLYAGSYNAKWFE